MRIKHTHLPFIKTVFHLFGLAPLIILLLLILSEQAGGEPVEYIIHYTGIGALNSLVAVLLISPLAKYFKQGILMQTRRLVGLYVFAYATLHILAFISLDLLFDWGLLITETVKRPYIILGAIAYFILILLTITSINRIKRKMAKNWQKLHNGIYLVAILVPVHFYWSVKSEIIEPTSYIIGLFAILLMRLKWAKHRTNMTAK